MNVTNPTSIRLRRQETELGVPVCSMFTKPRWASSRTLSSCRMLEGGTPLAPDGLCELASQNRVNGACRPEERLNKAQEVTLVLEFSLLLILSRI
ncbi:hypothetical protein E2C01_075834 [Portunus trituberculatus]|uniref:Uncharacterized protein n=1 Tax=Portunus trituberculatus TaxID=210409 RepID=A0A5B7II41_PORTR|nr:hypothetical protein [Portunus trituberculatus]